MSSLPPCPKCNSEYTYEDGQMLVCPECAHEWSATDGAAAASESDKVIKDSVGNTLQDGDTIEDTQGALVLENLIGDFLTSMGDS